MLSRTFWSITLLALAFFVREAWQFFKWAEININPFIFLRNYPIDLQWYVKFMGIEISQLLLAIVIYRMSWKIEAIKVTAIVFLIYAILDVVLFFACFNKIPYAPFFALSGLVILVVVNRKKLFNGTPKHKPTT